MKTDPKGLQWIAVVLLLAGGVAIEAPAQLAITEVMAGPTPSCSTPDYWELTNYGTDPIDLNGYTFTDDQDRRPVTTDPFAGLVIQGGKSVVFMRSNRLELTTQYFTNWWGESSLGPMLQEIRLYDAPGLSDAGDAIILKDASDNLVCTVSFGPSDVGRSFVPNPVSGLLIDYASPGVNGAFRSVACANDIGSPGHSPPAIPVAIHGEPADQDVDASSDAVFTVVAAGLPLPQYQWFYQGIPLPGATGASLTLTNVQPGQAGAYQVVVSNAFGQVFSRQATLEVKTNCACARIVSGPADSVIYVEQSGLFTVRARGYPAVRFQWSTNGVDVPGATGDTLELNAVTLSMSGMRCSVRVWNEPTAQCPVACPATNASAVLTVTRWPRLQITEVMTDPFLDAAFLHDDWFEVCNDDTFEVDLFGYRFAEFDASEVAFTKAFRITNSLILRPGESVIFAKGMSAEQFKDWWGRELLSPDLKIYTFDGFSLSSGEAISLWNPGARWSGDAVATCQWGLSSAGFSFEFSHTCAENRCGTSDDTNSVAGANGAFRAVDGGDTGSPGYRANPQPRLLNAQRDGANVTIRCRVVQGRTYRLHAKEALANPEWTFIGEKVADDFVITILDTTAGGAAARFYRLEEVVP